MIVKFLRNIRMSSQLREITQKFASLSRDERAHSMLMAVEFYIDVELENFMHSRILRSPKSFSSDECYRVYSNLELLKVYGEKSLLKHQQNVETLKNTWGVSDKADAIDQSRSRYYAILYWLARLATNVDIKFENEARVATEMFTKNLTAKDFDDASPAIKYQKNSFEVAKSMSIAPGHDLKRVRETLMGILKLR